MKISKIIPLFKSREKDNFPNIVQGQLLKIWHRMLIYHTAWICGP